MRTDRFLFFDRNAICLLPRSNLVNNNTCHSIHLRWLELSDKRIKNFHLRAKLVAIKVINGGVRKRSKATQLWESRKIKI